MRTLRMNEGFSVTPQGRDAAIAVAALFATATGALAQPPATETASPGDGELPLLSGALIMQEAGASVSDAPHGDRVFYRNPNLPENFPFSAAVVVGDAIYLSGELGVDYETFSLVEGGVGAETRRIFKNYETTLAALGAGLADIVKCTVFLDDMSDYAEMNAAYAAALPDPKPARSTIGVDGLALGAALEIECIAVRNNDAED